MIIENVNTGQRFEVAEGTHYPESAYRVVEAKTEPEKVASSAPETPAPSVVAKEPAPKPKKKPAKKKTAKSKK